MIIEANVGNCRKRLAVVQLVIFFVVIGLAGLIRDVHAAASVAKTEKHPDFSGFWILDNSMNRGPKQSPPDLPGGWRGFGTKNLPAPPLRKEVYEEFRARRAREEAATNRVGGLDEQTARCGPGGFPDMMSFGDPLDIFQRADEMMMVTERDRQLPRHIYISPPHPANPLYLPSKNGILRNNGHSVAHWEGDVLIIKTDGLDPGSWMFSIERIPHSDAMTVTERLTLSPDGKTMTNVMDINDPKTLTAIWTLTYIWHRAPADQEAFEGSCTIDPTFPGLFDKK